MTPRSPAKKPRDSLIEELHRVTVEAGCPEATTALAEMILQRTGELPARLDRVVARVIGRKAG